MLLEKLPEKDREMIAELVERLLKWAPSTLASIVLFGSMTGKEFHSGSDVDLLIVLEEDNPEAHLSEIAAIITSLKPHREIRPILTNLRNIDPGVLKAIARGGIVLHGKLILGPNELALRPYRIVSYNLSSSGSTVRQQVARRVYGYVSSKETKTGLKEYHYEGLKQEEGCYVLGRGVLALPESIARGFMDFLRRNDVGVRDLEVYL